MFKQTPVYGDCIETILGFYTGCRSACSVVFPNLLEAFGAPLKGVRSPLKGVWYGEKSGGELRRGES